MVGESRLGKVYVIVIFLLPSLVGLVAFNVIPIIHSIYASLTEWDLITPAKFIGIENYLGIFQDENSVKGMINTFKFVGGYIPLALFLSLIFAALLDMKLRWIKLYRALFFVPVIISWVVVSLIWLWLFNSDTGLINYLLSMLGIQGPMWLQDESTAMLAVIIASLSKDLGYFTIILLSGLQGISDEYYESADIDGANAFQKFFKITIPCLTPILFFVLVILLITSLQVFDQVYVMTGGGPYGSTRTLVLEIYDNAFQLNKAGFACAQAWFLVIIIWIVTVSQNKLQKRWVHYDSI
ncbi:MAG: sugar ABC transporter permease [Clostridia bacterium]|nr:sugar ABC transporter permease [Clostridia bacterium]